MTRQLLAALLLSSLTPAALDAQALDRVTATARTLQLSITRDTGAPDTQLALYQATADFLDAYRSYQIDRAEDLRMLRQRLVQLKDYAAIGGGESAGAQTQVRNLELTLAQVQERLRLELKGAQSPDLATMVDRYEGLSAALKSVRETLREESRRRSERETELEHFEQSERRLGLIEWACRRDAAKAQDLALIYQARQRRLAHKADRDEILRSTEALVTASQPAIDVKALQQEIPEWSIIQADYTSGTGADALKQSRKTARRLLRKSR